jgi:hypothetical protein
VSGRFPTVQLDPTGALYLPFPSSSRIEYSVISRSNPVLPADFAPEVVSYPQSLQQHYLQLPQQSERIAALAREITHVKRTSYEKIITIQDYLRRNFRYSLDAPLADQSHPLEEFLFIRKTGYCEHYATAMVIMLRTIGIPARLVTGFLTTEWNEYGNYYLIRQQDAHAWVEAHLPHSGWILADPTPATLENFASSASAWQALGRFMDSLRLRWSRFFVQYSADDQLAVVRELKAGSASVRNLAWDSLTMVIGPLVAMIEQIAHYVASGNLPLLGKFLGLILIGIGALTWLVWKRPWRKRVSARRATRDEQAITRVYRRMLSHLARKGISKPVTMPPLEFLRVTRMQWNEAGSVVETITELYCRARFGCRGLTQEELHSAQDCFRRLTALDPP